MNAELVTSVDNLEAIGNRHVKRGITLAAAALTTAAVGQALAYWLSPGLEIKTVHVPAELMSQLSNQVSSGSAFDAIESVAGTLVGVTKVIGFIGIGIAGIMAVATGNMAKALPMVIGSMVMTGAVSIISAMLPSSGDGASPRDRFMDMVKLADVPAVRRALADAKGEQFLKDYVISQAIVVHTRDSGEPLPQAAQTELARQVAGIGLALQEGKPFDADPRTVYLLERQTTGAPKSAIAQQYAEESARHGAWGKTIGQGSAAAAAVGVLISGGMAGLGAIIWRRVRRLRPLVSPKKEFRA